MKLFPRIRALFQRRRLEAEMAEELRLHLEQRVRENIASGMTSEEARFAAQREFGHADGIKEEAREQRGWLWLEQMLQDGRHALRQLRRHPGFTAVAVLSLALGIGANTAVFSVFNAVLLQTMPVADPASLVQVTHQGRTGAPDKPAGWSNFPLYEFLRDGSRSFAGLFAFASTHLRVRGAAGTEGVSAQWVTPNYFSVLGVKALKGRTWSVDDVAQPAGVVISQRFWNRFFGADPDVVGKTLTVSGRPATVLGVVPAGFLGLNPGTPVDLTLLLAAQPMFQPERGNLLTLGGAPKDEPLLTWELFVMGRLQPGIVPTRAAAETTVLFRQWAAHRGASAAQIEAAFDRAELLPGGRGLEGLRQRFSAPLGVLTGIVGCVLLIACANLASLLLARAGARRHEIGVRASLGASRGRLVRQLLTESLTLTTLGGAAGAVLGWWGGSFLAALLSTGRTPVELEVRPDGRMLLFTLAVSVLAAVVVGIVPALRSTARVAAPALKETAGAGRRWGLGQALVALQLGLSLCLLVGAGLFTANLRRINAIDPGYAADNLLSVSFDWAGAGYSRAQMMTFVQQAVERARAVPGVQSAGATHLEPLGTQQSQRWLSVRGTEPGRTNTGVAELNVVSADYFPTMNLTLVGGRFFDARDQADSPKVVIISEALARADFGTANPVGQPAWIARDTNGTPLTIVGVVRDVKQRDVREASLPMMFLPATQSTAWEMNLLVRTVDRPLAVVDGLRSTLADISPDVAIREITTPQLQRERSLLEERLLAELGGFFGPLALILAAIGLYGLIAYNVAQRTREIGVRMALGARPVDILTLVLRQGLLLVLVGSAAGLAGAAALSGLMKKFLFAISPGDPLTFLGAAAVLAAVAFLATWLPARRAARVDPMTALRAE